MSAPPPEKVFPIVITLTASVVKQCDRLANNFSGRWKRDHPGPKWRVARDAGALNDLEMPAWPHKNVESKMSRTVH
jgi:hypothetical protein